MLSSRRDAPHRWGSSARSLIDQPASGDSRQAEEVRPIERVSGAIETPGPWSTLSVVVPAKDEAKSLPRLVVEIADALRPLCVDSSENPRRLGGFEIVVVDDGSADATRSVLESLRGAYPELSPLSLAWNAGQSAATAAGFRAARGAWIATLDADLQNDPADLAKLWEALPGHDAALGWRTTRQDVWSKRVISRWANRIRNRVLGQSIRDTGCSVRIFPRSMALRLPMFWGSHRFIGPLLLREGCRLIQVPVNHRARPHGSSHYNFRNRSLKVVVDLFGVAWLMRRSACYEVLEIRNHDHDHRDGSSRADVASQGVPPMHAHASSSSAMMPLGSHSSSSFGRGG